MTDARQQSFKTPAEKTKLALEQAARREYDTVAALVSGGTDSLCAADAYRRYRERFNIDLPEIDVVAQTHTGTTLPSTIETAKQFCTERNLEYRQLHNDTDGRMLAHRVLEHGWPSRAQGGVGSGGHWPEFVNRKLDTWDDLYSDLDGDQLWISGGRVAESDRRAGNLGDGAVDFGETGDRRPRQTWVAPIHGWLDGEKKQYVNHHDIPRAPAYDWLGYSGDCVACAFDDPTALNEIRILCPELAYCLSLLTVWVYGRIRAGEIDQPIERAVWGTDTDADWDDEPAGCQRALTFGGCSKPDCKAAKSTEGAE